MLDTVTSLFYRLGSDAYSLPVVLVELLLIGLCVNWSAGVLKGTRGTRPLRGLIIILVVLTMVVRLLAVQFGWVRLDLLYSYVLFGLAVIAVVVFQPELRRAVIRIGDVRFQRLAGPQSQLISALVKAAGFLSRNKYGALIAIQRQVDLTGWAENGTILKAEVSANLLNTIFFPNTPLHDLGVIVRGNRLVAANCQFPSAESDEIDAALGSRHLAAVGMSYETDALVLVISEETGVVSLADNGKLTRYLSLDDLADELTSRLGGLPAAGRQRPLRSVLWGFVRRLAIVLPLTAVIWYLADQATLAQTSVRINVALRPANPATEVVDIVEPQPLLVTTVLRGPVRAIDRLRVALDQPLAEVLDLRDAYGRPGDHELDAATLENLLADTTTFRGSGLTIVETSPPEIRYRVEELVPVTARVQPDAGAVLIAAERVDPPTVDVLVRRSDVAKLPPEGQRFVRAAVEDLVAGLKPEEIRTFENVAVDERIGEIAVAKVTPRSVTLAVRVVGQRKRVENVAVQLYVAPEVFERFVLERADLNEWRVAVDVEGEESIVNELDALDLRAFVHVGSDVLPAPGTAVEEQIRTFEVIILAPADVSVVGTRTVRINLVPRAAVP